MNAELNGDDAAANDAAAALDVTMFDRLFRFALLTVLVVLLFELVDELFDDDVVELVVVVGCALVCS